MEKLLKNKIKENNKGFTLIETLVAVLIFATSIVTLIVLTAGGVSNTNFVKNRLAAQYLSEEGIDLVRAIRDSSVRYEAFDLSNLINQCAPSGDGITGGCIIEPNIEDLSDATIISPCVGENGCTKLSLDDEGFYTYEESPGSIESPFTRKITVTSLNGADEIEVESTVSWRFGNNDFSVISHEYLYSWMVPSDNI